MNDLNKPAVETGLFPYDVVILGAGYAGLMAALRLRRRKRGPQNHRELRIALVNGGDQFIKTKNQCIADDEACEREHQ